MEKRIINNRKFTIKISEMKVLKPNFFLIMKYTNSNLMKKTIAGILFLSFYLTFDSRGDDDHTRIDSAGCKISVISVSGTFDADTDTTQFAILIIGETNTVKINNKLIEASTSKAAKPNTINVTGEGNSVSVIQDCKKPTVNILQNGNNNQIKISQTR